MSNQERDDFIAKEREEIIKSKGTITRTFLNPYYAKEALNPTTPEIDKDVSLTMDEIRTIMYVCKAYGTLEMENFKDNVYNTLNIIFYKLKTLLGE